MWRGVTIDIPHLNQSTNPSTLWPHALVDGRGGQPALERGVEDGHPQEVQGGEHLKQGRTWVVVGVFVAGVFVSGGDGLAGQCVYAYMMNR